VNRSRTNSFLAPLTVAALALGVAACGDDDSNGGDGAAEAVATDAVAGDVVVADAWVRQPAEGQPNAAAYAMITNGSDDEITLVGASTEDLSVDAIEIHETLMGDDGAMSMQEKEGGFVIAPGESLTLEPGGAHVMMLGVDPAEFTGSISLTLDFDGADPVTVTAEVRSIDGSEMDDTEMDDTEMDGTHTTG
jgi:copper(I)-binding protein